ncbi:HORMA domain-containing protein 1-like isoform X4 [Cyanistes caeruleus]|uniref:HORMA domain-containing protein 1-like isoform X4 n=1 Tax=Cyanistes caeruleus TaxID=156563 RepID=UPI000CDB18A3|nr:HORMA domain-containing protein 1-like isoform X4 [Cyanistes caeruleus]
MLWRSSIYTWLSLQFTPILRQSLKCINSNSSTKRRCPRWTSAAVVVLCKLGVNRSGRDVLWGCSITSKANHREFVAGLCGKDVKQASRFLLRSLYVLMQDLGPLPNDITLSMKLLYYNNVTPKDYQPPGFMEDGNLGDFLFAGDPVHLRLGSVSTDFHLMKVKVITEKKRVRKADSNLIQKNGPTEISHQGLDCEEEEEEESTKNHPCPVRADSNEHEGDRSDTHPGRKTEASSFCLKDTGRKNKRAIKKTDRMPCSRACQQINLLNLAFSQEEVIGPEKKRKVSEPKKLPLNGRKFCSF